MLILTVDGIVAFRYKPYSLMSKYHVDKIYIDGANPSFIKSLNLHIGEDPDYDKVFFIALYYRRTRLAILPKLDNLFSMKVNSYT
jgi:hypothetical protein